MRRPGCVILAAAYGGDRAAATRFEPKTWLLAPTPDMKVYEVDDATLDRIVARVEKELAV